MISRMQLGCCCSIEEAAVAKEAGFDFLEGKVVTLLADEDNLGLPAALARYQNAALPVRAFNVFLPGDLKIVGPAVDETRLQGYIRRALDRVRAVGGELVVFGSGGARSIPPGFSRTEAIGQISWFLSQAAGVAEAAGLVIAIEPLNRQESNVINSVAEAVEIAQQVNRPSIRVLADFYHMDEEQEPLEHLLTYKDWLVHIHLADTGRRSPGTGHYPYPTFIAYLHQAGYQGRLSIECRWDDFPREANPSVQFLRRAWKEASAPL
jgi:sugar phosphate isomerase/epimerase